jgi:2-polyprenyl-6-methoxyphenol hydroxylase-like FAD-dependent oxidoreductase
VAADTTVLVVGAGPTGLLLAAELIRRGIDCTIIDRQPTPSVWDRATIVHPRSLEVFESLGIVDAFLERGVKQRFARLHSAGCVLGDIDLSLCGSRYEFNIGISEEVTESILTDYLHRQGGRVTRTSQLVKLDQQSECVTATILCEGATKVISADWVVGCDGYHSAVRQQCGIELRGSDSDDPWAVFDTTLIGWHGSHEAIYGYLDVVPVILTSLPRSRWRVYLRPSALDSDLLDDAAATLQPYFPAIAFADVANPTRFRCHAKVATSFRAGRVLLAGDAAHICSPSQGHGMNSGLQDAFNLAWKLALVAGRHCAQDLLNSYEAERRPVAQKNALSGDEFERAQDLTDPEQRRQRDKGLTATFTDPASCYRESISEAELDIDYATSPIVLGDANSTIGPGQRLPNTIEVFPASGEVSRLHELTHRAGHTVLLIDGADAAGDRLADIAELLAARGSPLLLEATLLLAVHPDQRCASIPLTRGTAEELGVSEITMLVIRPDGHVGLRADRDHLQALTDYCNLLGTVES